MRIFEKHGVLVLLMGAMFFSCSGNDGEGDDNGGGNGDVVGELLLQASKTIIVADGEDAATFKVMKGETDITGESGVKIYQGDKVFDGTSFSTTSTGDYEFFANYQGEVSKKITVKAIESGFVGLPEDPQPDKFDNFKHRTLLVQATGTWCPNCPFVISAIHRYQKENNENNAVFVASHNGDGMANDFSNGINNYLSANSFPSIFVDLKSSENIYNTSDVDALVRNISNAVSAGADVDCGTNISASVSQSEDGKQINVLAKVKIAKEGKYRILAWVLEDGIFEEQQNGTGLKEDFNTHNNVLRYSSTERAYGEVLDSSEGVSAGSIQDFACSFDIDKLEVDNLAKCRVVIMTTNPFTGKFTADNVVECGIGGTVAFEYK